VQRPVLILGLPFFEVIVGQRFQGSSTLIFSLDAALVLAES
jgi:hypothetical protein